MGGPDFEAPPSLGEAFARISALYFRGKLAYGRHFGGPAVGEADPVLIITPSRGLMAASSPVDAALLDEFADTPVDLSEPLFREPLDGHLTELRADPALGGAAFIFLGSLATPKYTHPLRDALGDRVWVPELFPGMGNLQRGSLLLKAVEANTPVDLVPLSACM